MLALYSICLILGGGLVVLSILGAGDVDVDVDVDVAPDIAPDVEANTGGEGLGAAARLLSVRSATFFAAFFGLTGTLLTVLALGPVTTAVSATLAGAAAAAAVSRVMRYLAESEAGELAEAGWLEGTLGRIVVDVTRERSGKISLRHGDRTFHLVARLHEANAGGRLRAGDEALVVGVDGNVAVVAGKAFLTARSTDV